MKNVLALISAAETSNEGAANKKTLAALRAMAEQLDKKQPAKKK